MLTPQQVLPFLEHPDRLVRKFAADYFRDCADPAPATALDALRAYDRYPGDDFDPLAGLIADLPVTAEAVREILRRWENASGEDRRDVLERAFYKLSMDTARAVEMEVAEAKFLPEFVREHVWFQVRQAEHTPEHLWDTMLEMAEQQQEAYEQETEIPFSEYTVESVLKALALHPEFTTPRVMAILGDASIEDYRELHAVTLAGLMKLEAAIPLLVHKLTIDADVLREMANDALTAIGTPEVVRQLEEMIPGEDWDVRLYADDPLERIKSVEAEEALLRLLEVEEAEDLRLNLAQALCLQGSEKGFDRVRSMVAFEGMDGEMMGLAETLYGLSVILGRDFPEAAAIRAEAEQRRREREREFDDFSMTDAISRMAKSMGLQLQPGQEEEILLDSLAGKTPAYQQPPMPTQPIKREGAKVGRNDPCPCGSGKKYKKCCGG